MTKKIVFTSKMVAEILKKKNMGIEPHRSENPWKNGEVGVRKENLVFGWTQDELDEFTKCAVDIQYFANNYCKIKREDGTVGQMTVRDYQYNLFETYTKNRFTINMSSRQTGKCLSLISKIKIKFNNKIKEIPIFKLLFKLKNKSIYDYIKFPIYWLLYKLNM